MYKIILTRMYTPYLDGRTQESSPNIDGQFIVVYEIDLDEFYSNTYEQLMNMIDVQRIVTPLYFRILHDTTPDNIFSLDIAKTEELSGREEVGYLKTIWLRILQCKWKKYMNECKKRSNPLRLHKRAITGYW